MAKSRIQRRRQRNKSILKSAISFFFICFLILGGVFAYFAYKVHNVASNSVDLDRGETSELRNKPVNISKDNISILFLGVDDRDGELSGRTDALVLATFNREEGSVKMTSIPRDTLVEIPGKVNQDKINHAHAMGGLDLAIDTVENLFDIPVDYYVKLNFVAFIEIIDALDGVEIDVPFTFTEMDSKDNKGAITLYQGLHTLNGEEALAYARMRMKDPRGDIGRGERQQEVIKAIIKKASSISSITKYGSVLDSLESHLTTNLGFSNMVSLHSYANSLNDVESLSLQGHDSSMGGIYYYQLEEESLQEISDDFKYHLGLKERPPVPANEQQLEEDETN